MAKEQAMQGESKTKKTAPKIHLVQEAVAKALEMVGGIEKIMGNGEGKDGVNLSAWTKFQEALSQICQEYDVGFPIQTEIDKNAKKITALFLQKGNSFVHVALP